MAKEVVSNIIVTEPEDVPEILSDDFTGKLVICDQCFQPGLTKHIYIVRTLILKQPFNLVKIFALLENCPHAFCAPCTLATRQRTRFAFTVTCKICGIQSRRFFPWTKPITCDRRRLSLTSDFTHANEMALYVSLNPRDNFRNLLKQVGFLVIAFFVAAILWQIIGLF